MVATGSRAEWSQSLAMDRRSADQSSSPASLVTQSGSASKGDCLWTTYTSLMAVSAPF